MSLTVPARGDVAAAFDRCLPALRAVARLRLVLLPALAAAAGWQAEAAAPGDLVRFAQVGGRLLAGRLGEVYADSWVQAGPWELLASCAVLPAEAVRGVPSALVWPTMRPVLVLASAALMLGLLLGAGALRRAHGLAPAPVLELVAGVAALVMSAPARAFQGGHPAQLGIAVSWIWAASMLVRGRTVAGALVLGLSAGWEPWGVLAAPLLLLERRPRRLVLAAAAFAAAAVLPYLPFVLTGRFALFDLAWPTFEGTLVAMVWTGPFPWQLRLLQGGCAALAGAAVTLLLGRRRDVVWLAPLAVLFTRLLLDPMALTYYWYPGLLLALAGLAMLHRGWSPARVLGLAVLAHLPQLPYVTSLDTGPAAVVLALPALVLVLGMARLARLTEPDAGMAPR